MRRAALIVALSTLVIGGCSSGSKSTVTIQPALSYSLANFQPATFTPGQPTRVSFSVKLPSGQTLTKFKRGPGPHTGIHLILVRSDLGAIVHQHPPVAPDGTISQDVTLPTPGRYRVVIDVYPATGPLPNYQLFRWVRARGPYHPQPLPPFSRSVTVDGYRFTLVTKPNLHAIQAALLTFTVTDPSGKPAQFTPWFGALAHAIFFRKGTLDYFHTHVCAPGATGCTSVLGATKVTGTSARPGILHVGVLVPVSGVWRLFLQTKIDGQIRTAPFTLRVR
ncbi:MAG TPA: hypothetical protein VEH52_01760 [Gaiellaceae bacterium]|nr:hypothetical protein [Gaiellaceae bacterium]